MQQETIISGFGGQGTLFAGQVWAYAAMDTGKHVTWIPSYGPEMRGGKARCTVIVADEPIGAPLVRRPGSAIVLNIPSFEFLEPLVKPDGVLIVNSSLIPEKSERTDIKVVYVPATEMAIELGDIRLANAICLGALAKATGVATTDELAAALEAHLPERHRKVLPLNFEALKKGAALA
jgi:2-oxoglutarate ferredoxin oxidoreductase subunit gamma